MRIKIQEISIQFPSQFYIWFYVLRFIPLLLVFQFHFLSCESAAFCNIRKILVHLTAHQAEIHANLLAFVSSDSW